MAGLKEKVTNTATQAASAAANIVATESVKQLVLPGSQIGKIDSVTADTKKADGTLSNGNVVNSIVVRDRWLRPGDVFITVGGRAFS